MSARYAIYYAPPPGTALWDKASAWLGRDAYTGEDVARVAPPGLEDLDLDAITADPRGYGFHATLKAPFELAPDRTEDGLLDAVRRGADALAAFEVPIAPAALGRFLAFQLQVPSPAMDALHRACVRQLDGFRAPLTEADIARRRKAPLTPEQDARMLQWGYPYVFEDFRFHMTLTGSIRDEALRARLLAALQDHFAGETGPHRFDAIAVFKQADREAPFNIVERFTFGAMAEA
jgi:putative phosphonate metabolism protein